MEKDIQNMNDPRREENPANPADTAHEAQNLTEQESTMPADTAGKDPATQEPEQLSQKTAQTAINTQEVQELSKREAETAQEVQEIARQESEALATLINTLESRTKSSGSTAEILRELSAALAETVQRTQEIYDKIEPLLDNIPDTLRQDLADANNFIKQADTRITEFCESDKMDSLQEIFPDAREWIESERAAGPGNILNLETTLRIIRECIPIIREYVDRTKYTGTLADFMRNETDPDTGEKKNSRFDLCLSEADETAEAAKNLLSLGARRVNDLEYPVDKVNNSVWSLLEENTHGQLTFTQANPLHIKAEPDGSKKPVDILYSINFDDIENESNLPIVKRLTQYDKRVYIAVGGLYNAGNSIVTISMIYQAMGYKGEPGKTDRDKINKSLTKLGAHITLDNWQEITANYKYPAYKYDGPLLPFERLTPGADEEIFIDGRPAEEYIHFFREPPLLTFAKGRKQVTTISQKLLQTPLSKTEQNIAIEDYCIERIAQYKREGTKILLSTLYEKCNITSPSQRTRTPDKLKKLFDYYVKCGEIKNYTLTKDAITFIPADKKRP